MTVHQVTRPPERGLLSNATSLLVGRLAIAVMGWAGTVLIVRTLGTEQFGQFALVFSVLGMTSIVTELGLGRVAISGVVHGAKDPGGFAGTYVVLRLVLGLFGYALAVGVVLIGGYDTEIVWATAVAGGVVLVATPSNAYDIAFQAHLQMPRVAIAQVLGQSAQLALTVALAVSDATLVWFMVPAVAAEWVILALKVRPALKLVPFRYSIQPQVWLALVKEAIPLAMGGALITLYNRVDTLMLSQLDTFDAVGKYSVAAKFADLSRFVATSITIPILTLLVRAWPNDLASFRSSVRRGLEFLTFFAGAQIVLFSAFSTEIIGLLYGDPFRSAGHATRILVIGASLNFFAEMGFQTLVAAGKHRLYPVLALIGLLANVGLNVFLIDRYSFEGAAAATLVTNAVIVVAIWALVMRLPGVRPLEIGYLTFSLVATAAGIGASFAAQQVAPWPVAAAIGLSTYVGIAEVTGATGSDGLIALARRRLRS